jgi:hemerythrin
MAFINWSEEFTTGIKSVDDQHRQLVDLVNKFEDASRRGKGSRIMSEILNDLVGYTQEHFAHEEKIMKECEFPGLKQHKANHRQLLQKIERFQFEFDTEKRGVTTDVRELLLYWVRSHILQDDMAYAKHLEQSRVHS